MENTNVIKQVRLKQDNCSRTCIIYNEDQQKAKTGLDNPRGTTIQSIRCFFFGATLHSSYRSGNST